MPRVIRILPHLEALCLLLFLNLLTELSVDEVAVLLLFLLNPVLEHMGQVCQQAETCQSDWCPAVVIQNPLGIFVTLGGRQSEQILTDLNVTVDALTE